MDSILTSIKKLLGISEDVDNFDTDIIIHINSVLMILNQLGVGPAEGFSISDKTAKWSDFIPNGSSIEAVKSYVYLKVRLMFDPPTSAAAIESMNKLISEYEWRINVMVETGVIVNNEIEDLKDDVNALGTRVDEHEDLFRTLVGESYE